MYFGSTFVDISLSQLNISSLLRHKSLSLYYKLTRLTLSNVVLQIYKTIMLLIDNPQLFFKAHIMLEPIMSAAACTSDISKTVIVLNILLKWELSPNRK